jgi:hypothetical protein
VCFGNMGRAQVSFDPRPNGPHMQVSFDSEFRLQLISEPRKALFLTDDANDLLPRTSLQPIRFEKSVTKSSALSSRAKGASERKVIVL